MEKVVTLDVGGKIFKINKKLLVSKSEYFENLFEEYNDINEIIYIDRSPHIFKHILAFIRDPTYLFPIEYKGELKYFLIDEQSVNFNIELNNINKKLDNIEKSLNNIKQSSNNIESNTKALSPTYCTICKEDGDYCGYSKDEYKHCSSCKKSYRNCGCSCWDQNALIFEKSKGWITSDKLGVGDWVLSEGEIFNKITKITKSYSHDDTKVKYFDGIRLTYGHPILINGEWKRPYELKDIPILLENKFYLYNLILDKDHYVILKNPNNEKMIKVATLGLFPSDWRKEFK